MSKPMRGGLLLLALSCAAYLSVLFSSPRDAQPATPAPDSRLVSEIRARCHEYHGTLEVTLGRLRAASEVVDQFDVQRIGEATQFAATALAAAEEDELPAGLRTELYSLAALCDYAVSNLQSSAESLRLALEQIKREPVTTATAVRRGLTLNSWSTVLGEAGKLTEAEAAARQAISVFEAGRDSRNQLSRLVGLAFAFRNLAILQQLQGQDGTTMAMQSLRAAEASAGQWVEAKDAELPMTATVDARLFVAQVQSLNADFSGAKRSLLDCRQESESIVGVIENGNNHGFPPPFSSRYLRQYLDAVDRNLKTVEAVSASQAENLAGGFFFCAPHHKRPMHTLSPDLLFQGKMLAEFIEQDGLAFVWRDELKLHEGLLRICDSIRDRVRLVILVPAESSISDVENFFDRNGVSTDGIQLVAVNTDSPWLRDYGPLMSQTLSGEAAIIDPVYGASDDAYRICDEVVPHRIARRLGVTAIQTPLALDGGELLVNGAGLCVVSTTVLKRNAAVGISEATVRRTLSNLTGAREILFVDPLEEEATGHLDWFMTFVAADHVVVGQVAERDDPNAAILDDHAKRLSEVVVAGEPLKVTRIPMAARGSDWFGGSYTNVLYANGVLLMRRWEYDSDSNRERALDVFRGALPSWEIVEIPADHLGRLGGSLHCLGINLPVMPPARTPTDAAETTASES